MSNNIESYQCPKCPTEELIRILGNLLTCPNCEIVLVDRPVGNNQIVVEAIDSVLTPDFTE